VRRRMFSGFLAFCFLLEFSAGGMNAQGEGMKQETSYFKLDSEGKRIAGVKEDIAGMLRLDLVSVTMDQPQYWTWEKVNLKILMPDRPGTQVSVKLKKKDSVEKDLGKHKLNEDGILVLPIMDGAKEKLELGEYNVVVTNLDSKAEGTTEFSVVEGALGALSLAYEFKQLTSASDLKTAKGGWFMGNAAGAGLRWGNGLNIRNELRVSNLPYNGSTTIKSRCFLPGCNGCEAGKPVSVDVKDGVVEAVMDVGGHSGPFEIEVITDKGSVKYLFEATSHVERSMVKLCYGMGYIYRAGLAPYEGTVQVPGRQIYIEKEKKKDDDAVELTSAYSGINNKITIDIEKPLENLKVYVYKPENGGKYICTEMKELQAQYKKGESIIVPIEGPYSLIVAGGYLSDEKKMWEGYAICFTPSSLTAEISVPESGNPNSNVDVTVMTKYANTGEGVSVSGILEVFDNRVASKNPINPLNSAVGDSFRNTSNSLSSWEDRTGMWAESAKEKDEGFFDRVKSAVGGNRYAAKCEAPSPMSVAQGRGGEHAGELEAPEDEGAQGEAMRQGEEKVVYCGFVKTDANGKVVVSVKLPPQTGRCNARFVAVKGMDYTFTQKTVDMSKKAYVECHLHPLLVPECKISATAFVFNNTENSMTLTVSGAGIDKTLSYEIKKGGQEVEFSVYGKNYGKIIFELKDNSGKLVDKRELETRDIGSQPVTFSNLLISDGKSINVERGRNIGVYKNAGQLLGGIVMNITTTMYSWFGHAEALSASCAVRAILLQTMDRGIITDEGLRQTLVTDLKKCVRDLNESFFDRNKGLISPYPGIEPNPLWSAWTARNLNSMVNALKSSKALSDEFSQTVLIAENIVKQVNVTLEKLGTPIPEIAGFDPNQSNRDVIPVEIDGKVYYQVITDDAVIQWVAKKFLPAMDLENCKDLSTAYVKAYDTFRFLRAYEHTGLLPYMIQNAKALWLAGEKERGNFDTLFGQIAKGAISTQDAGMIQGPALLGGVYSSPQTMIKFLELLIMMSDEKALDSKVEFTLEGKKEVIDIAEKPLLISTEISTAEIVAPKYSIIRVDEKRTISLTEYLSKERFFKIGLQDTKIKMGQESAVTITLDKGKDPFEYYAMVVLPSTVSLRQTEDILSDYKGQLLYGQKSSGGGKVQFVTVPFRGNKEMTLSIEGSQKGVSEGLILVRSINNPDDIGAIRIPVVEVN